MYIYYLKDKNINGDKMIQSYSIKIHNNEEILYLYLDYSYEFASTKNNNKPFFQQLKKILNNKIINFKGTKIVLIVSGIVIGTIFLKNINYTNSNNSLKYVNQVILNDFLNKDEYTINIDNINNEDIIINDSLNKQNEISYTFTNNTDNQDNKQSSITTTSNNNIENNNEGNQDNINTYSSNIIVTIYRKNGSILNIEMEEYLIGVVAAEMPASFNTEALKAQAIIARTYALKSIERNKLLTDTVSTQAYIDTYEMQLKWGGDYNLYYNKIKEAVNSTEGLIITYNNELIDAVYFANSNGYTEDSKEVWGNTIPYLKSVESPYDINTTRYKKNTFITYEEASNILGFNIDQNVSIYNILRNESNRVTSITINDKTYTGIEFRNLFKLNSADFEIEKNEFGLNITTYGYGHGVGMSQYGANGMANNGYGFDSIIKYYYKGVSIEKNT